MARTHADVASGALGGAPYGATKRVRGVPKGVMMTMMMCGARVMMMMMMMMMMMIGLSTLRSHTIERLEL